MGLTNTQKGRAYQKRQQNKGLCTRCGHKELYSAWYCYSCWRKHKIYQEKYRRSKGKITRKEYLDSIKKEKNNLTLEELQKKYNIIKRTRIKNSISLIKQTYDLLIN